MCRRAWWGRRAPGRRVAPGAPRSCGVKLWLCLPDGPAIAMHCSPTSLPEFSGVVGRAGALGARHGRIQGGASRSMRARPRPPPLPARPPPPPAPPAGCRRHPEHDQGGQDRGPGCAAGRPAGHGQDRDRNGHGQGAGRGDALCHDGGQRNLLPGALQNRSAHPGTPHARGARGSGGCSGVVAWWGGGGDGGCTAATDCPTRACARRPSAKPLACASRRRRRSSRAKWWRLRSTGLRAAQQPRRWAPHHSRRWAIVDELPTTGACSSTPTPLPAPPPARLLPAPLNGHAQHRWLWAAGQGRRSHLRSCTHRITAAASCARASPCLAGVAVAACRAS